MNRSLSRSIKREIEMAKSYGIKILAMKTGEEVIASVDEFSSTKVTLHFPLLLVTESIITKNASDTSNTASIKYNITFRSWMKNSPQQHFTISKDMYNIIADPYDDIAKEYIEIVRKLPREDKKYLDMETVLGEPTLNTPKGIGQGSVYDGMREPTKSELDKVVNYMEQCGFVFVDAADIMDAELSDEDYENEHNPPESGTIEGEEEYFEDDNNEWNPHDRWSD
jgi:hypothetical protein